MLASECEYAVQQRTWMDRQRFRPQQWSYKNQWQLHSGSGGERWHGFDCVRDIAGFSSDLLLVPLPGHTFGHAGVAVRQGDRWMLLAGDAYFYHREMDFKRPWCTPGLRLYQTMLEKDRRARLDNQKRLRRLKHEQGATIDVFSSHDIPEFERLSGRSAKFEARAFSAVAPDGGNGR